MEHPLHKTIGECIAIDKFPGCKIIRDPACGGHHNVPLFCSKNKSNKTEYCDVDLLILKDDKIRVIIEIEETAARPTQVCGKFLTSALSSYFIHESENNAPIGMSDTVTFIQILKAPQSKKSFIPIQWENLEESIKKRLPLKESRIQKYILLYGSVSDFENRDSDKYVKLITCIEEALR